MSGQTLCHSIHRLHILLILLTLFFQLDLSASVSLPSPSPSIAPTSPSPSISPASPSPSTSSTSPSPSIVPTEPTCTYVSTLLETQYNRYVGLLRRGPCSFFLGTFYAAWVHALEKFVAKADPDAPSLGSVCLDAGNLTEFHATVEENAVLDQLELLRNVSSRLFYLPESSVPDVNIPTFEPHQQVIIDSTWEYTEEALEAPPSSVFMKVVSVLPPGLKLFYDPAHEHVCANFRKWNVGPLVKATNHIRKVASLAVRLHMLGVDDSDCINLLQHATAHVFNGIRCERKQNGRLLISQIYMPFYLAKFKALAPVGYETMIPDIPIVLMKKHYRNRLRILSSYNGWGMVDHLFYSNGRVVWRNISKRLFKRRIVEAVHKDAKFMWEATNYGNTLPTLEQVQAGQAWHQSYHRNNHWGNWLAFRTVTCEPEWYYAYPSSPASTFADCCALLCQQTELLALISGMTEALCCSYCNQDLCDLDPFSAIPAVDLEEYIPGDGSVRVQL